MSQVATTNGATQDKTQKQDKPQGEKGGKREGNTFKGNRTDKAEEHKGEREPREPFKYKPRHRGLAGEKITVTLETVIPDLPKKNETHAQPSDEAFQAELDKIQKDIDDCYKKISDLNKDARKGTSFPSDKGFTDLVDLLKVKQEEKRRAYTEFQGTTAERDLYKKQIEDYHDRANELRFKMKVPGKRTDLEAQLKQLNGLQTKGNITIQQEKNLIKEISEIQRSLPFAGPLEELEIQAKEINELLKVSKEKTSEKFKVYKSLRDVCQEIEEKITKMRDEHEEKKKKEDNTPAIEKMKEEYRSKITTLKQKKKDTYESHKESWRKYEEQQTEIERIKLMRRKKEKLVREEQRRVRDEEWKKQKALEEEENKEIPYRGQIELCELLIKYCNKLTPSAGDADAAVDQKDKQLVIEEALKTEEWKQAKGQYLTSKREKEDDFFSGAKKTKKKVAAKPQETQPTVFPLNHQIETLNFFEEIKVAPPLFVDKLPETLKVLQEKKASFEKLSQEAIQADEARSNMTEEEKKKYDEEEKQKKAEEQQQQQQQKSQDRRAAKKRFDVESEQDFPKM